MSLSYDISGYSLLHKRIELVLIPVVIKIFLYIFEINSAVLLRFIAPQWEDMKPLRIQQ